MQNEIVGARIRQRRRELGVTQAKLARMVGISPSYLNLIEWNKRRIGHGLLTKTAEALGLDIDELDGASERRLHERLVEIAHLPALVSSDIETARASELIGRFPGWARGLATMARSEQEAVARAQTLSDRLSNDPFLSEAIHRMLTRIAAIRSAADILMDYPDISEDRRSRFNQIIHTESRALSDVGEALAKYLDKAQDSDRILTPLDEVEALFESRENHFEAIETAAVAITIAATDARPVSRRHRAREAVEQNLTGLIDEIVDGQPQITTSAARARAIRSLTEYAVGSVLMPMGTFAEQAAEQAYDIEALAEVFSAEIEAVCHRLTALPSREGTPKFGYFRANAAGTIIEMLGLKGLALPRYASVCPLWALFRAQQSPETVIRQRALFPSGARFVFAARARLVGPSGFGKPRHYVTDMIAMTEADSRYTVYRPDPSSVVEEVGPSCRMCPRTSCDYRVEDPFTE